MGRVETVFYGIQPFAGKNRPFVITRGKSVITSYKTLAIPGDSSGFRIGGEQGLAARKAVVVAGGDEACGAGEGEDLRLRHVPGEAVGMGDDAIGLAMRAGMLFRGQKDGEDQAAPLP